MGQKDHYSGSRLIFDGDLTQQGRAGQGRAALCSARHTISRGRQAHESAKHSIEQRCGYVLLGLPFAPSPSLPHVRFIGFKELVNDLEEEVYKGETGHESKADFGLEHHL